MRKRPVSRIISGLTALCMSFTLTLAEPVSVFADTIFPEISDMIDDTVPEDADTITEDTTAQASEESLTGSADGITICETDLSADNVENDGTQEISSAQALIDIIHYDNGSVHDLKLINDITLITGPVYVQNDTTVNIDLNGHTITLATDYDACVFDVSSTLFITDSKSGGRITGGRGVLAGGIKINNGGNFIMYGGSITGNSSANNGGGVYVLDGGTFEMYGGNITGNSSVYNGGGVYVSNGGKFDMHNGSISENTSGKCGGGIYIKGSADAALYGGSITGSSALENGGGVYVSSIEGSSTSLTVCGNVTVKNNTVGDTPNNVYLTDGSDIYIPDGIGNSEIHITTQTLPASGQSINITRTGSADYSHVFFSDNEEYETVWDNATNTVVLKKTEISSWDRLRKALEKGGTVTLTQDITAESNDDPLTISDGEVTLDLAGFNIDRGRKNAEAADNGSVFIISGGKLTITDNIGTGTITGGNGKRGGGIYISDGTVTLESGSISGNKVYEGWGAGIYMEGGRFIMTGGSIAGNRINGGEYSLYGSGGGIFMIGADTEFIMTGGTVSDNEALLSGGGIDMCSGTLSVSGGNITNNSSRQGTCGVEIENGDFYVSGSLVIKGNHGSDIVLSKDQTIKLNGALEESAELVVHTSDPKVITYGYGTYNADDDPSLYFKTDSEDLVIRTVNGEAAAVRLGEEKDQPEWIWNGDHSAATARMGYTYGDEIAWEQSAAITRTYKNGIVTVTASVTVNGKTYTNSVKDTVEWSWSDDLTSAEAAYKIGSETLWTESAAVSDSTTKLFEGLYTTNITAEVIRNDEPVYSDQKTIPYFWEWEKDHSTATLHIDLPGNEDYVVIREVDVAAVYDTDKVTYNASAALGGRTFTDTVTVDAAAEEIWTWAEDYKTADLTYKINGQTMWQKEAQISSIYGDNAVIFTASVTAGDNTYTDSKNGNLIWNWSETYSEASLKCVAENKTLWEKPAESAVSLDNDKATYTAVVVYDEHTFTSVKEQAIESEWQWADDYLTASVIVTVNGERNIFDGESVTVTCTENDDHSFSVEAVCEHSSPTVHMTAVLDDVPSFCVTAGSNSFYIPRAQNRNYAVFTVTKAILDSISAPEGAVVTAFKHGSQDIAEGDRLNITENTELTAEYSSVWAKVAAALRNGGSVSLYNDITPGDSDIFLYIPADKTATLALNGHTIDRQLDKSTENGFVIRVDGKVTISDGIVTGGNNTGDGGGVFVNDTGDLTLYNAEIYKNLSSSDGGGIFIADGGKAKISGGSVTYNIAGAKGGGLYVGGEAAEAIDDNTETGGRQFENIQMLQGSASGSSTVDLSDCTINYNTSGSAGGIYVNSGTVTVGNGVDVTKNKNAEGNRSNLDASENAGDSCFEISGLASAAGKGVSVGLPGSSLSSLPTWAKGFIGAGMSLLGAIFGVLFDHKSSSGSGGSSGDLDPFDDTPCLHSWQYTANWNFDYTSVTQEAVCSRCGKYVPTTLTPSVSVNDAKETIYSVTLGDGSHSTKTIEPYIVELFADFESYGLTVGEGVAERIEIRLAHRLNESIHYDLPVASPWEYDGSLYLKLDGWLLDGSEVVSVDFDPYISGSKVIVKPKLLLPVVYSAGITIQDDKTFIGKDPEPNPVFVEFGQKHELFSSVYPIPYYRKNHIALKWNVSSEAMLIPSGSKLKVVFKHTNIPDFGGTDPGTEITVTKPTEIKPVWIPKWSLVDHDLNSGNHNAFLDDIKMQDVSGTKTNKTIVVLGDATLDLNGHKLSTNGIDNRSYNDPLDLLWFSYTEILNTFDIPKGSALTVKDTSEDGKGVITNGANITDGGCVHVFDGGVFTLEGGTLKANSTVNFILNDMTLGSLCGGAVYISSGGTAYMKGGSIKENVAYSDGGGVYISEGAVFEMTGGEISNNEAGLFIPVDATKQVAVVDGKNGGGVYVGGTFNVSGKVIIKNNKASDITSNVYLPTGKKINVTGKLDKDAEIHVSMQTPGVISSGLNANGGNSAYGTADNFVSDNENYTVIINRDGEAELVSKIHTITVADDLRNGTVISDKKTAMKGETVTLTVDSDENYLLSESSLEAIYYEGNIEKKLILTHGTGDDINKYTFTMPEADVTVRAGFELMGVKLAGYSLSLDGDIGVNFYMELSPSVVSDNGAYMEFTLPNGSNQIVYVNKGDSHAETAVIDTELEEGKTYYVFKCNVAAKEMNDKIYARIVTTQNGVIKQTNPPYEYSVREYADAILDDTSGRYDKATKDLVYTMLVYGSTCQIAFDHNTANLADHGVNYSGYTSPGWTNRKNFKQPQSSDNGISYYASALVLKTKTHERHYFIVTGDIDDYIFCINGKITEAHRYAKVKNCCYIDSEPISSEDLGTSLTVQVIKKADNQNIMHFEYSPLDYIDTAFKTYESGNKYYMQALALYEYFKSAETYVTVHPRRI